MPQFDERYYASEDGLRLYYRDYSGPNAAKSRTPVLCIPGLTRNSRDFEFIAERISETRRVLTADLRGRGQSAYDPNPKNYAVAVEARDVFSLLEAAGAPHAIVLGTSRGGIIAMTMAAFKPAAVAGVILNDVGGQLEPEGLERIHAAMRAPPDFSGWEEAALALKRFNEPRFPDVSEERWLAFAHAVYQELTGHVGGDYDPKFPSAFLEAQRTYPRTETGAADLWKWFRALQSIPTLVLRGEYSDLLSEETVVTMAKEKADLKAVTVRNRGHVPFLDEPEAVEAIDAFLEEIP